MCFVCVRPRTARCSGSGMAKAMWTPDMEPDEPSRPNDMAELLSHWKYWDDLALKKFVRKGGPDVTRPSFCRKPGGDHDKNLADIVDGKTLSYEEQLRADYARDRQADTEQRLERRYWRQFQAYRGFAQLNGEAIMRKEHRERWKKQQDWLVATHQLREELAVAQERERVAGWCAGAWAASEKEAKEERSVAVEKLRNSRSLFSAQKRNEVFLERSGPEGDGSDGGNLGGSSSGSSSTSWHRRTSLEDEEDEYDGRHERAVVGGGSGQRRPPVARLVANAHANDQATARPRGGRAAAAGGGGNRDFPPRQRKPVSLIQERLRRDPKHANLADQYREFCVQQVLDKRSNFRAASAANKAFGGAINQQRSRGGDAGSSTGSGARRRRNGARVRHVDLGIGHQAHHEAAEREVAARRQQAREQTRP